MPNSKNKKVRKSNSLSKLNSGKDFNSNYLQELISELDKASTINEAESAVNWIFEKSIFLENL